MTITSFFQLVEIKTKVASVFPFFIGSFFTLYAFGEFDIINGLIMFLGMLIFDMTTTAINNYIDYIRAVKKEGYGYEVHNAIGRYNLNPKHVKYLIFLMLAISTALGLILVMRTDLLVLILGMLCFAIGILYTFGPLPISRTPLGEIFSGLTMGLLLTFISIYVHIYNQGLIDIHLTTNQVFFSFNYIKLFGIGLICIPMIFTIANIMLANNLCDMEDDLINKRYTLPLYIGSNKGLIIWQTLYFMSYVAIIVAVCIHILPVTCLLTLLTFNKVIQNINVFKAKQEKQSTFIIAIQNFLMINGVYLITLIIGCILKYVLCP